MIVTNVEILRDVTMEEYLAIPRMSHSGLRNNGKIFTPSPAVRLGSSVDNYLNDPKRFEGELSIVRPLAAILKREVGELYPLLEKQVVVLADFIHNDKVLRYKGRPDWCMVDTIVIDTKVAANVNETMHWFGYPNQVTGYCLAVGAPVGYILAVSPKRKDQFGNNIVDKIIIHPSEVYWENMVHLHGEQL
jgi:hypothetical protein